MNSIVEGLLGIVRAAKPEDRERLAGIVNDYRERYPRSWRSLTRLSSFTNDLVEGLEEILDLR